MKTEILKNALGLSAEELAEAGKIKEHIVKVLEKDFYVNYVGAGFSFLEISVYANYTDYIYRIKEDRSTEIKSCAGYVKVPNKVGETLLNEVQKMKEENKFINVKLLSL